MPITDSFLPPCSLPGCLHCLASGYSTATTTSSALPLSPPCRCALLASSTHLTNSPLLSLPISILLRTKLPPDMLLPVLSLFFSAAAIGLDSSQLPPCWL